MDIVNRQRAPLPGSKTEAWTSSWTDGKPSKIARGELRWEGARRKRGHREPSESSVAREQDGSVDIIVDGREPSKIARGELRWEGARRKRGHREPSESSEDGSVDIIVDRK